MKKIPILLALIFFAGCEFGERIGPSGLPYMVADYFYLPDAEEPDIYEYVPEPLEETSETIPDDGVLRLQMRPPTTLNPILNTDVTVARVLQLVFEPLAVFDSEFRVSGLLAELEFASDFSAVNATVREGAIWSDGRPVSADDIVFSVETLLAAPASSAYSTNAILSAVRINARTAQINFTGASVMAGYALTFPIIPQHFFERASDALPPASGAFIIESITPMRNMTLRRNPYFLRGRAQIAQAEITFLPDAETDFYAFERGRTDVLHMPLTEWVARRGVRSPAYEIFPAMYFEFIGFNFRNPIFRDVYTRRGIAYAFNACDAVAGLYLAHAVRSVTPLHPHNFAANADAPPPIYDPARAAALLGTIRLDAPLQIIANAENPQRVAIAKRLAESLAAVGLDAYAEILAADEYFARIDAHEFDLFIGGMELDFAPDVRIFFEGGEMFLHDLVLESAFSMLLFAGNYTDYAQAKARLQQAFAEQLPVIGLAFRHSALLAGPRITGDLSPVPGFVFINAHEWAGATSNDNR